MMKRMLLVLSTLTCVGLSGVARANWEYGDDRVTTGWYQDDGRRFIIAVRGGIAYGMAKLKNDVGTLGADYYDDNGQVFPCSDLTHPVIFEHL